MNATADESAAAWTIESFIAASASTIVFLIVLLHCIESTPSTLYSWCGTGRSRDIAIFVFGIPALIALMRLGIFLIKCPAHVYRWDKLMCLLAGGVWLTTLVIVIIERRYS